MFEKKYNNYTVIRPNVEKKHNIASDWKNEYNTGKCILEGVYRKKDGSYITIKFTPSYENQGEPIRPRKLTNTEENLEHNGIMFISYYIAYLNVIGIEIDDVYYNVVRLIGTYTYIVDNGVLDHTEKTKGLIKKLIFRIYGRGVNDNLSTIFKTKKLIQTQTKKI